MWGTFEALPKGRSFPKFKKCGAKFVVPVSEHHDGFSMWNNPLNSYNAVNMGPQQDVVGELATATRKQGLAFGLANLAWATGQTVGAAASGVLAQATSDLVPFALLAAVCLGTLIVLRTQARRFRSAD